MHLAATIANTLWRASNIPAYSRFRRALRNPELAQEQILRTYLNRNEGTAFGRTFHFEAIRNYHDFARRVPLADYDSFEPWIARIQNGEQDILTRSSPSRLVPTSGSTRARKLIPFTPDLQHEFNQAIGP